MYVGPGQFADFKPSIATEGRWKRVYPYVDKLPAQSHGPAHVYTDEYLMLLTYRQFNFSIRLVVCRERGFSNRPKTLLIRYRLEIKTISKKKKKSVSRRTNVVYRVKTSDFLTIFERLFTMLLFTNKLFNIYRRRKQRVDDTLKVIHTWAHFK